MRRFLIILLLGLLTTQTVGCAIYSADPTRRARQLLTTSENMRALLDEWERFWFLDQPDHMTPHRTHGGVI